MIKKARDIQLGDRIGGRLVARLWHTTDSYTVFAFADDLGEGSVCVRPEEDVWVDDPAPCCKLEPVATYTRAEELKPGMLLCLPIIGVDVLGELVCVHTRDTSALYLPNYTHLRYIKEASIEP